MPMSRSQCRDFQFPGVDISSANSTKSYQKSLCFKINDKSVRHFEKKREEQIFVSLKITSKISQQSQFHATVTMPISRRMAVRFTL